MAPRSMERIFGAAARGLLARIDEGPHSIAVRTQAAVVRSLVDELGRHVACDACAVHLRDQVKDELVRLMQLLRGLSATKVAPGLLQWRDAG